MTSSLRAAVCFAVFTGAIAARPAAGQTLADAQRLFYNAHYEESAALAESLRASAGQDLANDEVRTTALLFVLRGLLKGQDAHNGEDKGEALSKCCLLYT